MATTKERGQLIDTPKALQSETVTQQLPSKGQDAIDKSTNLNFDKNILWLKIYENLLWLTRDDIACPIHSKTPLMRTRAAITAYVPRVYFNLSQSSLCGHKTNRFQLQNQLSRDHDFRIPDSSKQRVKYREDHKIVSSSDRSRKVDSPRMPLALSAGSCCAMQSLSRNTTKGRLETLRRLCQKQRKKTKTSHGRNRAAARPGLGRIWFRFAYLRISCYFG